MYRLTTEAGIPLIPERLHDTKKRKEASRMSEYIYVLGVDGDPQMPTKRKRHVEQLLQTGRARVFRQIPFTIQLTYENKPVLQPITIAEDPGRSNIGMAVVSLSGELLSAAVVQTRNKEIVKLMDKRKQHRRASRNGERKARQRLAKKCHTMIKAGFLMRKLPMYGKDKRVKCLVIKNTESRFCNRKREDGWLTPSAEHLVQTHINLIHKMQKFLPITDVAIEINRFAFLSLEDPSISGVGEIWRRTDQKDDQSVKSQEKYQALQSSGSPYARSCLLLSRRSICHAWTTLRRDISSGGWNGK